MNRRTFLASVATLGAAGSAGCASGSTDRSPSATPTLTPTTGGGTTTPAPVVTEELETARQALTNAFEDVRALRLIRGPRIVAMPEPFEKFDPEPALEHVAAARAAIDRGQEGSGQSQKVAATITGVRRVADVALPCANSYWSLRNCFRQGWYYEQLVDDGHFERSVEELALARQLVETLASQQSNLTEALDRVANSRVEPEVDGFDPEFWRRVAGLLDGLVRELRPAFAGFETFTEALIAGTRGREALAERDGETAYEAFQLASDFLTESRRFLGTALDRDNNFFRDRTDGYWCRSGRKREVYQIYIESAAAFGTGDERRGERLRREANREFGGAIASCPV